ncbi:hypothetical protein WHR41_06033 [Cladosporium halotolerans]|uniref:Uncharacterized protein n=1 Tax=Cladosporium halotolerans TaxID=1052096 RepID=A0AB34KPK1_9PEZI
MAAGSGVYVSAARRHRRGSSHYLVGPGFGQRIFRDT